MAEIHNSAEKGIKVYAIPMSENLVKDKFIFAVATTAGEFVFASHISQENWKAPPKKASDK